MAYPYERFLRFLITRKANLPEILDRFKIPQPGSFWLSRYRDHVRTTAPAGFLLYFNDRDAKDVLFTDGLLSWARGEGILSLWESQREFGKPIGVDLSSSMRIFANSAARAVLGMLLLSRCNSTETCSIFMERFDYAIDVGALMLYKDLFWDITNVSRSNWPDLLRGMTTAEERHFITVGLDGPSASEVRYWLGLPGGHLTPQIVLQNIMEQAHYRFKEAMEAPSPEEAQAMQWARLAIDSIRELNRGNKTMNGGALPSGERPDFNTMFSVKIEKQEIISVDQLDGEVSRSDVMKKIADASS